MIRRLLTIGAIVTVAMAFAGVAVAGGWAMTVVDEAPDEFEAGAKYQVTYTILQHGRTPVEEASTHIEFTSPNWKDLRFPGSPTGVPGQYVATVELPEAGSWHWAVGQGGFGLFDLGDIEVGAPAAAPAAAASSSAYLLTAAALLAGIVFIAALRGWGAHRPAVGASPSAG